MLGSNGLVLGKITILLSDNISML